LGSGTAKTYLSTRLTDPGISSSVRAEFGAAAIAGAISSSVAGAVS